MVCVELGASGGKQGGYCGGNVDMGMGTKTKRYRFGCKPDQVVG